MRGDSASGPLAGIRVLDLTHFIAGPFGTMHLADLGADVVKIEQPAGGDMGRRAGVDFVSGESVHFWSVNKNKRSAVIDLKSPEGLEIFLRMVERADVVVNNFRPGVMERLGIGYEVLSARNPQIVLTSISAFGQNGPYADLPGYDLSIQALSGVMSVTGEADRPPVRAGVPIADLVGGLSGMLGTLAALVERCRTGRGQNVDVALLDTQVSLLMYWAVIYLATGEIAAPVGAGHPTIVPYGRFETADGYLVLAVFGDRFFQQLCRALGTADLLADERLRTNPGRVRHRALVEERLGAAFRLQPTRTWLQILSEAGVPAAPVNNIAEALADPQVEHRNMIVEATHPLAGRIRLIGNPIKTTTHSSRVLPPPLLGEHTRDVLREYLGLDDEEIDGLEHRGITAAHLVTAE